VTPRILVETYKPFGGTCYLWIQDKAVIHWLQAEYSPKRYHLPTKVHGVTFHAAIVLIFTAVWGPEYPQEGIMYPVWAVTQLCWRGCSDGGNAVHDCDIGSDSNPRVNTGIHLIRVHKMWQIIFWGKFIRGCDLCKSHLPSSYRNQAHHGAAGCNSKMLARLCCEAQGLEFFPVLTENSSKFPEFDFNYSLWSYYLWKEGRIFRQWNVTQRSPNRN
jgi:hypothetical protein